MGTNYNNQQQRQASGFDPGWMLICAILSLCFCLMALPWIILGFIAQRLLTGWLHWRLRFLLWLVLFFLSGFILYARFTHSGLNLAITHEITDYIAAAKHSQFDLARWPLGTLWTETWPIWLSTFPAIGIAGFAAEVSVNANAHPNTARALRRQENHREKRAQRLQERARKRASLLARLPQTVNGMMLIGIAIEDDNIEEGA